MKVLKFGINMILVLICMSALSIVACKKKLKKKENATKVSKSERAKIRLQVVDLQERMQVVMETQGCIVQNCSSSYADGSRKSLIKVNTKVVQAQGDKILPDQLKQLVIRVNGIEEIHVGLLKSACSICAK